MSAPTRNRSRWCPAAYWAIGTGLVVGALYAAAGPLVEFHIRKQLDVAAGKCGALVDGTFPPTVAVDLLKRSVRITGLVLLPSPFRPQASIRLQGRCDTLEVTNISIGNLILHRTISVQGVLFRASELQLTMVADSLVKEHTSRPEGAQDPWSLEVGSFSIGLASISCITSAGDTMRTVGDGIQASGSELQWSVAEKGPIRSVQHLRLDSDGLAGTFANGYAWTLDRLALAHDRGALDVYGVRVGPVIGLERHSAGLTYETDVILARIDTIQVSGLDLDKGIASGTWSARKVMVATGEITVLRDKTMKDGPSVEQPLFTRLVRRMPIGSGVDSIAVSRLEVRYLERADPARGYAEIPFGGLEATITGVRNRPDDTTAFMIKARCIAFEVAPVSMVMRSMVQDTSDRFVLDAAIGTMPFTALNRATGPLVDIRCTAGRIDSVIMHMDADDRHATGSVYINYQGIKMYSGGKDRNETMHRLSTLLLNTVVRNDHTGGNGVPREGRFSFPRRRDRAVFNYMWSGLREGTKAMLLPGAMTP